MTTRNRCVRRAVGCALVAIVTAAVSVAGKPHQSFTQDDYARAMLAQYFPAAASSSVIELTPTELPEPASFRSSRSDDRWTGALTPSVLISKPPPAVAKPPPPAAHVVDGVQPKHGVADVHAAVAAVAVPCKAAVADGARANDTSSAVTVEKLAAFYEQLKSQQETLARQQFQQQLYEQQQRRQQEFALVQQQIQQQYYQQQQHAILMLDQMRKNPAFVRQLAAFVDHKTATGAHNGTSAEQHVAAALPEVAGGSCNKGPQPLREKDQTIANHMDVGRDDYADDDGAKHLDARQAARQSFASSSSDGHRKATTFHDDDGDDDDDDDSEADLSTKSEDSQTSAEKE
ncbi:uncharacterized protein LOC113551051 [Rhopalosiphum maidis]|uniref:uncharacterized protein LOC113551051 n=1 Tax=Rhopalosiphum maidis TaxID=43146 RepID=UPI000EFF6C98|nr:uncharacterized protein LOC113551051 [Rhopalosiphum maidis]